MAGKIKLVTGDNLPYVRLTLTDPNTGSPINLSNSDITVRVYFRAAGSETVLATIVCEKVNGGTTGVVRFNFPGNTLNVDPGLYEGEVEVDFDGQTQTIYEVLKFVIREQFA